eukprot:m.69738 g.69738  ORF g.69738 m.69738 type:complete len:268 (-) comp12086_c0_seq3:147-950(-)
MGHSVQYGSAACLLFLLLVAEALPPNERPTKMVFVPRRGHRPGYWKPHPIKDVAHVADLTLRLKPLEPNEFNDMEVVMDHHKLILKMGEKYGMNEQALTKLERALKKQLFDYANEKKEQDKFNEVKEKLDPKEREEQETKYRLSAMQMHSRLFKLKMESIKRSKAKQQDGFQFMKELARSDTFTNEERENLTKEIEDFIKNVVEFEKQQRKYNDELTHKAMKQVIDKDTFDESLLEVKKKIVKHQEETEKKKHKLLNVMKSRLQGDL